MVWKHSTFFHQQIFGQQSRFQSEQQEYENNLDQS